MLRLGAGCGRRAGSVVERLHALVRDTCRDGRRDDDGCHERAADGCPARSRGGATGRAGAGSSGRATRAVRPGARRRKADVRERRRRGRARCAFEEREPDRDGDDRETLERAPLALLHLGEPCAVLALGEMVVEPAPLLPPESTVELLRQRELRALARDEVLELLGERPTRSEEQRLERSRRESEQPGDLVVRAALELPHDERLALRGRNTLE